MERDEKLTEPAELRLARYLKEFVGIRSSTIRDVAKYDQVLWFHDMPQAEDCWSGAWTDEIDPDAPWLEVRKQTFEPIPEVPEKILPWADMDALKKATDEIPPLKESILVPEEGFNGTDDEEPPLVERWLVDHPNIQEAYERYRPTWEAWATEHRRREAIQGVYANLFQLHTRLRKEGELIEVVLGLGLLDWNPTVEQSKISIRRHAVVARTEIEFSAKEATIRLIPPAEGARLRIEDDMLEADLRPDRSTYESLQVQLDDIGDAIWDRARMHAALKAWAEAISPHNSWHPGIGAPVRQEGRLIMGSAPALIVRKRLQTGMARIYESIIEQLSSGRTEIPRGWAGLVDDIDDDIAHESIENAYYTDAPAADEDTETYFPLPANREQRHIVDAIRRKRGVLVQGPPGTGKSHTIANLICHLLAKGERVLVTAETSRALQVLQDKLPDEIKPLCVSLLGQGGDAFSELNRAVQGITTKQATYTPGKYDHRIAEIGADLDQSRRDLATIDSELLSLREGETVVHSIVANAYSGTASKIASRVANERNQFGWLKLPYESAIAPPCSSADLLRWLGVGRKYAPSETEAAKLEIPASSALPTPSELIQAISTEREATEAVGQKESWRVHPAYGPLSARSPGKRANLREWFKKLDADRAKLSRPGMEWLQGAIEDLLLSRGGRWNTVAELTLGQLGDIESRLTNLGNRVVSIANGHDPRKVKADAEAALAYLNAGGSWKRLGFIVPKELKDRTYLTQDVRVDGVAATDPPLLQAVCDYLSIQFAFEDLHTTWQGVAVDLPQGDWRLRIADLREHLERLEVARTYVKNCFAVTAPMESATPPIPVPNWRTNEIQEWLAVVDAVSLEDRLQEAREALQRCIKKLNAVRGLHNAHPVVDELIQAIESRDASAYSAAHSKVIEVETTRADLAVRADIEAKLERKVPGLVSAVERTLNDPAWDERLADWEKAWQWALADNWLEKRADIGHQLELYRRREATEHRISSLLAETASLRAWRHFFARLSTREANALKAWRETVKAMGKGTGKSAKMARLRREAREYMDECRDAIPIWIMPRYLVAEMVDPKPGRYDHIIVDEASQLGIESLFLFYIGKKMIVVGDDQQISPMGVGVKDELVAGLQQQFLQDVRYKSILSAQSSLYSNAKVRYQQNIVLREHFRCMPEIIQFSNDLCYANHGTPLDPLRAYPANRKPPLVLRHVPDGHRTGSTQNAINAPEAEAIVAQIVACIEDPRYAGASMGVISLQGEAQANYIANLLLKNLDAEVIEERWLICGDAYAFQGDERDIMFLSMVAAPGSSRIGTLSADSARQRFNVAASRARDQMWLFHSATLDVLSTKCMRHRLLSYFIDPTRQVAEEETQRFDSEFEREVFRMIAARGFHVRTQVCVGDPTNHRYRIDLVVEGMQGRLAVECDGDAWHGPDRYEHDMARQRDLERAGWQFVRIRGGDFYRDQEEAMRPLWDELERLGIRPGGIDEAATEPPSPTSLGAARTVPIPDSVVEDDDPEFDEDEFDTDEVDDAAHDVVEEEVPDEPLEPSEEPGTSDLVEAAAGPSSSRSLEDLAASAALLGRKPKQLSLSTSALQPLSYVQKEPKTPSTSDTPDQVPKAAESSATETPYGKVGTPKEPAQYLEHTGKTGPDPRKAKPAEVAKGLCEIIHWEGPVLARRAYSVYLKGCGIQRMGKELKKHMNRALQHAVRTGRVVSDDEMNTGGLVNSIVRLTGTPQLNVRTLGHRTIDEVPPSELQAVSRYVLRTEGHEAMSEAHFRAILDYYGLLRLTEKTRAALRIALECQRAKAD